VREDASRPEVPQRLLGAIDELLSLSSVRNLIVHSARTWWVERKGMVLIPILSISARFNGWYVWYRDIKKKDFQQSHIILQGLFDKLTDSFNISQEYLSEKTHEVLGTAGFKLEGELNNDT